MPGFQRDPSKGRLWSYIVDVTRTRPRCPLSHEVKSYRSGLTPAGGFLFVWTQGGAS